MEEKCEKKHEKIEKPKHIIKVIEEFCCALPTPPTPQNCLGPHGFSRLWWGGSLSLNTVCLGCYGSILFHSSLGVLLQASLSLSAQLAAQKWLKTKLYLYVFIFARWFYGRNINIFPPLFTAATIQVRRYTRMWQPLTWPGQHMVHRPRQSAAWQMIHRSRVRIVYTERHNRERENGPPRRWWPTTKHCEATNMCLYLSIYLLVNMTSPRSSFQVWTRYQCLRGSSD